MCCLGPQNQHSCASSGWDLTPADPVSMLLMAAPLCLLYVLGIGMCKYMPRGRSPFEEAYEP